MCVHCLQEEREIFEHIRWWMKVRSTIWENIHRVLFCPAKSSSSPKDLVWSRKLPDSSKGIYWLPAGKHRCPGYHYCCSVHMLISPKAWPEMLSLCLFLRENDSIIFLPDTHGHADLSPHTTKLSFPSIWASNLVRIPSGNVKFLKAEKCAKML